MNIIPILGGLGAHQTVTAAAFGHEQGVVPLVRSIERAHDTTEAVVVEATLALSRDEREHAYVREIAAEVNRRLEARGETVRLSPEKVGHRLKKVGLRTRPLSQTGKGLTFDNATVAAIRQLAALYVMEDAIGEV